ncbi:M6 family metalloprotease domain-containing protein [Candidatus Albibeggiatoa sp. nov. BB20]|uniref:M6 family metalloprotease domain-containing protein n=1 Tax=Candidatus Albibeggiatoa sp. nov. BB20 TaxID=3162723 RepID=UPI003365A269
MLLIHQNVLAAPSAGIFFEFEQPNGLVFEAKTIGDEWNHWIQNIHGYTISKGTDEYWYYVLDFNDKAPILSSYYAHLPPLPEINKNLRPTFTYPPQQLSLDTINKFENTRRAVRSKTDNNRPVLFIFVEFDTGISATSQLATYTEADFAMALGDVIDYYSQASYNRITLSRVNDIDERDEDGDGVIDAGINGNGVIRISLPIEHPDTQDNLNDPTIDNMIQDAITAVFNDGYIDFSDYEENNGDNNDILEVEELAIVIIAAGYEASCGAGGTPSIWGHRGGLNSFTVDGITISRYAAFGEIHSCNGDHRATIGIMAHELGHLIFGLPDLYDLDRSSKGIGGWGLMSGGGWGRTTAQTFIGESPILPSAWARYHLGWVDEMIPSGVTEIVAAGSSNATTANSVFKLETDEPQEYFLVENRQPLGFDEGLERHLGDNFNGGLAIWHIDDRVRTNHVDKHHNSIACSGSNAHFAICNNNQHRKVDLMEADNEEKGGNGTQQTDLWSNSYFGSRSEPESSRYGYMGTLSSVEITDISASSERMSADFLTFLSETTSFTDVPTSYWAYPAIEYLFDMGLTTGCGDQTPPRFCPDDEINRAEMAVFLSRIAIHQALESSALQDIENTFVDVDPVLWEWAIQEIESISRMGITNGVGNDSFSPEGIVNREQTAAFLTRLIYGNNYIPQYPYQNIFIDVLDTNSFFPHIEEIYRLGITSGYKGTPRRYGPSDPVTRAQMAVFLYRYLKLINNDFNDDGTPDRDQINIISMPNPVDGTYITLEVSPDTCAVQNVRLLHEDSQVGSGIFYNSSRTDFSYDYPQGLISFEIPCETADVILYYHGSSDISEREFRKHGPETPGGAIGNPWTLVPSNDPNFASSNINGETVATVTFTLNDNQRGDSTGDDGNIVDPGGAATSAFLFSMNGFSFDNSSQPLVEANIKIGNEVIATVDSTGYWEATGFLGDRYPISIIKDGYTDISQIITLSLNSPSVSLITYSDKTGMQDSDSIVVGTNQNSVLVYSPQGEKFQTISVSTPEAIVATKDIDADSTEEIAVQNDATYEVTGGKTDIAVTNNMFLIQANVKGDATLETIIGSQTTNEISIDGETITVFESSTLRSRGIRKNEKVTICHKGKELSVAESALKGHLGHGDTVGSCSPPPAEPNNDEDDDDDNEKDDEEDDNDRKVTICHYDDKTDSFETISVSNNALDAHLAHPKDSTGACLDEDDDKNESFGVNAAVAGFNQIVVATASNGGYIEVITADGSVLYSFTAFDSNTGVIIAAGNILGDETPEIIAAAVGGSEIIIFDIQGNVLNSFTIDGIVTSLAIAKQFAPTQLAKVIEPPSIETPIEESNFLEDKIKAPICPSIETSTNIISGCKGNGAELPEGVAIREDASVSNVVLNSTPKIKGTVSDSEIKEGATVEGGRFTGTIINNGTLKNIRFRGHLLTGGILAGVVETIIADTLGYIEDVELAEGTILIGGVLRGTIKGHPKKPALIVKAWIRKGAKLSHVRLGADVRIDNGVEKGEGVEHENTTLESLETTKN